MEAFACWVLWILAGLLAIPIAVFCLEIFLGVLGPPLPTYPHSASRRRIAVLVPAHNESTEIGPTLEDINAQLHPGDRLLVVADNCSDDTAAVSRSLGAEVVDRYDSERVGKGYALDCGLRHLGGDPPEIVVMIDADCRIEERAIDRLASVCSVTGRPAQACYLMTTPDGSQHTNQVAEFAWRLKNWVRPLGLGSVGLPCQLVGTGMAIPWHLIRSVDVASGWIVEDLKLGLDLAAAGHPPLFCPSARVTSQFAQTAEGAVSQRKRWEHGHIGIILKQAPQLLRLAVARSNLDLVVLVLDIAVPPLSLLAILLTIVSTMTVVAALVGLCSMPMLVSVVSLIGFAAAVVLAWSKYGRDILAPHKVLLLPYYILAKLGLYGEILFGKVTTRWVRTDRTKHR
jgi:cellulose synthase/poly-beta-1,6-N-acetylglucosamine synthase-like glycosyltransferase